MRVYYIPRKLQTPKAYRRTSWEVLLGMYDQKNPPAPKSMILREIEKRKYINDLRADYPKKQAWLKDTLQKLLNT